MRLKIFLIPARRCAAFNLMSHEHSEMLLRKKADVQKKNNNNKKHCFISARSYREPHLLDLWCLQTELFCPFVLSV